MKVIIMIWKPLLAAHITKLLFAYAFNQVTSVIFMDELFTVWTCTMVLHLEINISSVSQFYPIFFVKALTWHVVLVSTFCTDKVSTL